MKHFCKGTSKAKYWILSKAASCTPIHEKYYPVFALPYSKNSNSNIFLHISLSLNSIILFLFICPVGDIRNDLGMAVSVQGFYYKRMNCERGIHHRDRI